MTSPRNVLERLRLIHEIDLKLEKTESAAQDVRALQEQREGLLETIPAAYRYFYLRIKRAGGKALARVSEQRCLACNMLLHAQLLNEVRKCQELHQCPSCKRILDPGKE